MLKHSDLFHIPYYQKAAFTGSLGGMRFYIEKAGEKDARLTGMDLSGPVLLCQNRRLPKRIRHV